MAINTTALTAVSPIDGRYRKLLNLSEYFSEYADKVQVRVEIEYISFLSAIFLCPQLKDFKHSDFEKLKDL